MEGKKILVVDDEQDIRSLLQIILEASGFEVLTASSGRQALDCIAQNPPQLMLLDLKMPKMDGMQTLRELKKLVPNFPVIIITAYGDVRSAVECMRLGAYDYITKPFDNAEIILTINKALELQRLKNEVRRGSDLSSPGKDLIFKLMGNNDQIKRLAEDIQRVAPTDYTIIIQGETGTGKELVARSIHCLSQRTQKPFVPVDCSAVPETLIESELFGYQKGAFTGANRDREGYFQLAQGGTFFLDEISNLSDAVQAKLLRTLQEREITPLGKKQPIKLDMRIIAASNTILEEEVRKGRFRPDLFHRLNEFTLNVPPLRERKGDLLFLAHRFLDEAKEELQKGLHGFSQEAIARLYQYDYPGNVRELRNMVRRAALLAEDIIGPQDLDLSINYSEDERYMLYPVEEDPFSPQDYSLKEAVRKTAQEVEIKLIREVLSSTKGNASKAAKILKIDYKTLHNKIRSYGIMTKEFLP